MANINYTKLKLLGWLLYLIALLAACHSKTQYDLSEDLSKDTRKNFIAYLEQGKELYKINCSKCHGIIGKGMEHIPNFTQKQIETYKAKIAMKNEQSHGFTEKLSYQQIESILHFLSYRKLK